MSNKLLFFCLFALLVSSKTFAQNGIFFQAVARDNFSNPAKDRMIYIQTTISQTTAEGPKVLIENFQTNTDGTGVFSISIGQGSRIGGTAASLNAIDWANGPYFINLKISIRPVGPATAWDYTKEWINLGSTPFGTVPYALYAGNVAGLENKLNISDTAKMLAPYANMARCSFDSSSLSNRINAKANTIDVANSLSLKANESDVTALLANKENASKKSLATDLGGSASSDILYPTQNAVKTYVDAQVATATIADADVNTKGKIKLDADNIINKLFYFKFVKLLKTAIKKFTPDVLHAHYATSYGLIGALSGFHPFVISAWGTDVMRFPQKNFINKFILQYN